MTGIRTTRTSHQVFVRVPAKYRGRYPFATYTKRFKLNTSMDTVKNHYHFAAGRIRNGLPLDGDGAVPAPAKSTLRDDAVDYKKLIRSMPTERWRVSDIDLWVEKLGDLPRDEITRTHVRAVMEAWRTVGPKKVYDRTAKCFVHVPKPLSANTVNHRRTALADLYSRLDGKTARNPARDVPKYDVPVSTPRALPLDLVEAAFALMPRTRPTALLRVLRWTGWPQAQIAKIERHHLDLDNSQAEIQKRKKGKGWQPRTLPLLPQAVDALKELASFGFPKTAETPKEEERRRHRMVGHMRRAWRSALAKVRAAVAADELKLSAHALHWLEHARPYDLRHSFGTMLAMLTPDRSARQELMMHSDPRQTDHYARAAADPMTRAALEFVVKALPKSRPDENSEQK